MFLQSGLSLTFEKKTLFLNAKLNFYWKKLYLTILVTVLLALAFIYIYPLFFNVSYKEMPFIWFAAPVLFVFQGTAYLINLKKENKILTMMIPLTGNLGVFFAGLCLGTFFTGSGFMITNFVDSGVELFNYDFKNTDFGLNVLLNVTNLSCGLMILFLSRMLALILIKRGIEENLILKFRRFFLWNSLLCLAFFLVFFLRIFIKDGFAYIPDNGEVYFEKFKYLKNLVEMPLFGIMLLSGVSLILFSILKSSGKYVFYAATLGLFLMIFALFSSLGFNSMIFYPSTIDFQSSISLKNGSANIESLYKVSYASILVTFLTLYIVYSFRKKA
jgi:cytochrome d ubiquinol oxidase subunit II